MWNKGMSSLHFANWCMYWNIWCANIILSKPLVLYFGDLDKIDRLSDPGYSPTDTERQVHVPKMVYFLRLIRKLKSMPKSTGNKVIWSISWTKVLSILNTWYFFTISFSKTSYLHRRVSGFLNKIIAETYRLFSWQEPALIKISTSKLSKIRIYPKTGIWHCHNIKMLLLCLN